jgi:nucleotide-binding universal stress UspA family protein
MPYTSLLVPLDYGPQSDRAVQIAGRLAARAGVPIELITVTDPRLDPDDDRGELLHRVEQASPVACFGTVLRSDDVAGSLAKALHDRPDALPVIGTAAPGPLAELFAPGVWEGVLGATGRPALLVGPHVVDAAIASRPLVIGVTPGADASRLADTAGRWSETFDVDVSVVDLLGEGGLAEPRAQSLLRDVSSSLLHEGLASTITVVRQDHPAEALLARSAQAIPVVSSAHWTTGERVHRSSIARELVRTAKVTVLVIPAARPAVASPAAA